MIMTNMGLNRLMAVATSCLLALACSREVAPERADGSATKESAEEKVYDDKGLREVPADSVPERPAETVTETPNRAPRVERVAAENVYTDDDLAKLPQPTALPPPLESEPQGLATKVKVYTNDELKRLPAEGAPDRDENLEIRIRAAERSVTDAQARVAELEDRLRAVHNPLLPRPSLPPEEEEAWKGLDGVERAKRVEKQLEQARRDLSIAMEDLERLRR